MASPPVRTYFWPTWASGWSSTSAATAAMSRVSMKGTRPSPMGAEITLPARRRQQPNQLAADGAGGAGHRDERPGERLYLERGDDAPPRGGLRFGMRLSSVCTSPTALGSRPLK